MNLIQDQAEIDNWHTSTFLPVRGMATETPTPTVTATATDTAVPTATSTPTAHNGDAHYFYDGDNNLVLSIIDDVTTYYPNSSYEKRVEGGTEKIYKYYFVGSARIAMRENGVITWLLGDHLGSTSVTVDASGNLLSSVKYTAYGEIRTGNSSTDYQYTGQRNEAEIGLYYYVARFYDPQLARFISADTLVPEPGNLKSYDRYGYVNNNPINYNDPTGNKACSDWDENGKCVQDPEWRPGFQPPLQTTKRDSSLSKSLPIFGSQNPWVPNENNSNLHESISIKGSKGFLIGPASRSSNVVDYFGDYPNDPIIKTKNPIVLIPAYIELVSRFSSLNPTVKNDHLNIFVNFQFTYHPGNQVTIDNLSVDNYYSEDIIYLRSIYVKNSTSEIALPVNDVQLSSGFGAAYNISGLPKTFDSRFPVRININTLCISCMNFGSGSTAFPFQYSIIIPPYGMR